MAAQKSDCLYPAPCIISVTHFFYSESFEGIVSVKLVFLLAHPCKAKLALISKRLKHALAVCDSILH
jgi:hypothetical protein